MVLDIPVKVSLFSIIVLPPLVIVLITTSIIIITIGLFSTFLAPMKQKGL